MVTVNESLHSPLAPSAEDSRLAGSAARSLGPMLSREIANPRVQVAAGGETETVEVPAAALRLFLQLLAQMAEGNAVTLVPVHYELSTQEAADMLNVSRPYLIGLLEEGKIPFHRVGNRRRIRFNDLMAYKAESNRDRRSALQALVDEAQELGMGY